MPKKNKRLALNSRIQTYQILTNDDVSIPSLSSILLVVLCPQKERKKISRTRWFVDQNMSCSYVTQIVSKNTIFGLKMMVKSCLEKIFLKSLHAGNYSPYAFPHFNNDVF